MQRPVVPNCSGAITHSRTKSLISAFRAVEPKSGLVRSGQVMYGDIRGSSASTLRRYSFGLRLAIAQADARPARPYPSNRTPTDAKMKPVDIPSAWSSPTDLGKKESEGRDPPPRVAPLADPLSSHPRYTEKRYADMMA